MSEKDQKKELDDQQEPLRDAIRGADLGHGINATLGLRNVDGSVQVLYHFSNKLKGLKRSTKSELGTLSVEFSSSKSDDVDILHFLSQKMR